MVGETNLKKLINDMTPVLNPGEYVFVSLSASQSTAIEQQEILGQFKEMEGITFILSKQYADSLQLSYSLVMAWITLKIHSSLEAVGLTATFSAALGHANISCNVIAGFYHDHIFVSHNDGAKAIATLEKLSER